MKNFIENTESLLKGITGSVMIEVSPTIVEAIPSVEQVGEGVGIVSQILVLIATLIALFRKKK